jgi:hypothetical protein
MLGLGGRSRARYVLHLVLVETVRYPGDDHDTRRAAFRAWLLGCLGDLLGHLGHLADILALLEGPLGGNGVFLVLAVKRLNESLRLLVLIFLIGKASKGFSLLLFHVVRLRSLFRSRFRGLVLLQSRLGGFRSAIGSSFLCGSRSVFAGLCLLGRYG